MLQAQEDQGRTVPALDRKPRLTLESNEVAQGFRILARTRQSGGLSVSRITLSEIGWYITLFGDPWCGRDRFINFILDMDEQLIELTQKKPTPIAQREAPIG